VIPYPLVKRLLDVVLASVALLVVSPVFYIIIIFVRLNSSGSVFFKQQRFGKDFKPFQLVKFRSMTVAKDPLQEEFEPGDDTRVTRVGSFLRRTKLDELPELFNVLNGNMSVVGPRPEVEKYVRAYPEDFKEILRIRPGLSDYASIKYRDEEAMLAGQPDPERYYCKVILPDKLHLGRRYLEEMSLRIDIRIIIETIKSICARNSPS
jgi:lipopolysaccharide/colanic/teichoic acid biosynthesis glycosyltransferase